MPYSLDVSKAYALLKRGLNIPVLGKQIRGFITIPKKPLDLMLFSDGGTSGRLSPRNQFVANVLQDAGFVTLLVDLLTEEDQVHLNRFI